MKRITTLIIAILLSVSASAEEMDMKMLNAQLKFIKENADLTSKEYKAFSKLYIDYNKKMFEIGQRTPPDMSMSPMQWNDNMAKSMEYNRKNWEDYGEVNAEYFKQLEKQLSEKTRQKIYDAQVKMWQKLSEEWNKRSQEMMHDWNNRMRHWDGAPDDSPNRWRNFYNDFYKQTPTR